MVTLRAVRGGHSLPELMAALTFLGAALAGITSSTLLAGRVTADAVVRQRALSAAASTLDSLGAEPGIPGSGSKAETDPPWVLDWRVDPAGAGLGAGARPGAATLRVTVTADAAAAPIVDLRGLWIASPPEYLP
jgi:Tfp pilus assembly protein PilV